MPKHTSRRIHGKEKDAIIEYLYTKELGTDDLREWLDSMGLSKSERTLFRLRLWIRGLNRATSRFSGFNETQRQNLVAGRRATQLRQNKDGSVEGFQISIERPRIVHCEVCGYNPPNAADEYRVEQDAVVALRKHWEFHEGKVD